MMKRNTARAIEKYALTCICATVSEGWFNGLPGWFVGRWNEDPYINAEGVVTGTLETNPANRQPHFSQSLDEAVEDWCNARNLPYERER